MEENARIDYFRSEIKGEVEKVRKDFDERTKALEAQLADQKQRVDGALKELRRI